MSEAPDWDLDVVVPTLRQMIIWWLGERFGQLTRSHPSDSGQQLQQKWSDQLRRVPRLPPEALHGDWKFLRKRYPTIKADLQEFQARRLREYYRIRDARFVFRNPLSLSAFCTDLLVNVVTELRSFPVMLMPSSQATESERLTHRQELGQILSPVIGDFLKRTVPRAAFARQWKSYCQARQRAREPSSDESDSSEQSAEAAQSPSGFRTIVVESTRKSRS